MTPSLYEPAALPAHDLASPAASVRRPWRRALGRALGRSLGLARPVHALLVDAHGVWAWDPRDCHAPATRHASVTAWLARRPGCDMRLWVGGELARSVVRDGAGDSRTLRAQARLDLVQRHGAVAQNWALATWHTSIGLGVCALSGIDLAALTEQARRHDVRVRSVVPWWSHALAQALCCANSVRHAAAATICVVEGRQVAWIAVAHGLLADVQQTTLADASVGALHAALTQRAQQTGLDHSRGAPTVVLGQGLIDGAHTQALNALVLGRLDGAQPPQWLRPSLNGL